MDKDYKDDPNYRIVYQAVIDANKDISRKRILHQIIYFVVMILLIVILLFVVWNVLGLKETFEMYNNILE